MSGTAKVVAAGSAKPSLPSAIGPIETATGAASIVPSLVLLAKTETRATPAGESPGFNRPRLIPVWSTDAGTVTRHDCWVSEAGEPATTGERVVPVTSHSSSLRSGVTLLRHVDGKAAEPVTFVGTSGAVVDVVDVGAVVRGR